MKTAARLSLLIFLAGTVFVSCAKREYTGYEEKEREAFEAWVAKYAPDAMKLGDTGVYYEIIGESEPGAEKIVLDEYKWADINYAVKDLSGNVVYNRYEEMAKRQGEYTPYTHYVPDFMSLPKEDDISSLPALQGLYYGIADMKIGEKRRLYMPSYLGYGSAGLTNQVGYGGQYGLSGSVPMIVDELQVLTITEDPEEREKKMVEDFIESWGISKADSIKDHLYMRILNRTSVSEADTIQVDSFARVYYVGRFLDGFVFDTNIDTVWRNTFGILRKGDPTDAVKLTRKLDKDGEITISTTMPAKTFSFLLPELRYGDSIQVVLSSRYAYYSEMRSGKRTSSSSETEYLYNPYLFGGMYGYGGYNMYGGMYGYDYYDYMYNYYNTPLMSSGSGDSGEIVAEIKQYTPLTYTFVVYPPESKDDEDEEDKE